MSVLHVQLTGIVRNLILFLFFFSVKHNAPLGPMAQAFSIVVTLHVDCCCCLDRQYCVYEHISSCIWHLKVVDVLPRNTKITKAPLQVVNKRHCGIEFLSASFQHKHAEPHNSNYPVTAHWLRGPIFSDATVMRSASCYDETRSVVVRAAF